MKRLLHQLRGKFLIDVGQLMYSSLEVDQMEVMEEHGKVDLEEEEVNVKVTITSQYLQVKKLR